MTLTIVVAAGIGLWIGALVGQKRKSPWRWRLGGSALGVLLACGGLAWENERALSAPACYWCGALLNPGHPSPFRCPHCGVADPKYRGYMEELDRVENNTAKTTQIYGELLDAGVPSPQAIREAGRRVRYGE